MSTDANGSNSRNGIVSKDSLVPVSVAIAIATAAVTFHMWLTTCFGEINKSLGEIAHRIDALESGVKGSWSAQDMKVWEMELRQRNPTLSVPDAWNVLRRQPEAPPSRP